MLYPPSKIYRHTAIVEFLSRDPMDPLHIVEFLKAALTTEIPRYQPFDPLGRIDRGSVRTLSVVQEPVFAAALAAGMPGVQV